MHCKFKLLFLLGLIFTINACGVGGVTVDDCENPPPSRVAECEAEKNKGLESSNWDSMKWDDDTWG